MILKLKSNQFAISETKIETMKRILFFGLIITILASCGNSGNGELIGAQNRAIWQPSDPYGMVYIPQGSFNMGPSDQDVPFANVTTSKTISVSSI